MPLPTVTEAPRVEKAHLPADLLAPCASPADGAPSDAHPTGAETAGYLLTIAGNLASCGAKVDQIRALDQAQ